MRLCSMRALSGGVLAALVVVLSLGTADVAFARTDGGSFTNCPRLSENHSTGSCVERLQNALNTVNPDYRLDADGVFGRDTRIAVLDFQGRNNLDPSGIVGKPTADELQRQALAKGSVRSPRPGRPVTPGSPAGPTPKADPSACDGKPATSSRLAKRGDVIEVDHKLENKSGATVTLKYSPSSGCAWALVGPVMRGSGAGVWLEYSEDGGQSWSSEIAYQQITFTGGVKHTGAIPGARGNVRACADISLPDWSAPVMTPNTPQKQAYGTGPFCTKTMKPL